MVLTINTCGNILSCFHQKMMTDKWNYPWDVKLAEDYAETGFCTLSRISSNNKEHIENRAFKEEGIIKTLL